MKEQTFREWLREGELSKKYIDAFGNFDYEKFASSLILPMIDKSKFFINIYGNGRGFLRVDFKPKSTGDIKQLETHLSKEIKKISKSENIKFEFPVDGKLYIYYNGYKIK